MHQARLNKKAPKTKRFVILLVLIFIILFSASLISKLISEYKKSVWLNNQRLNLVVDTDPLLVLSIEPQGKDLGVIVIPEQAYVEVIEGKGFYNLGSVFELGNLEGKGGWFLAKTIENFLGVPIDGWIKFDKLLDKKNFNVDKDKFIEIKKNFSFLRVILSFNKNIKVIQKDLQTNLSFFDLLRLWFDIQKVRFDRINFVDLSDNGIFSDLELADGTIVKEADFVKVDEISKKIFLEEGLKKENIDIEILNGTKTPGLAKNASRILNNIGAKVIKIDNSEEKLKVCLLRYEKEISHSFTFKRSKQIFSFCQKEELKEKKARAQLILILGDNYQSFLFGK